MEYLATIYVPDFDAPPGEDAGDGDGDGAGERRSMGEAYARFHHLAGAFIRGGEALQPPATAVTVRDGGPGADAPLVVDGPFTEAAEVIGGYYVLQGDDRFEVESVVGQIPAASLPGGFVEVQPLAMTWSPDVHTAARAGETRYLALNYRPAAAVTLPGSPAWQEDALRHEQFQRKHADALLAAAALDPGAAVTTVRMHDGRASTTEGPAMAADHVVVGFYLLRAASAADARALAQDIPTAPGGGVELRPVVEFADR
jgi:hypothetical protein